MGDGRSLDKGATSMKTLKYRIRLGGLLVIWSGIVLASRYSLAGDNYPLWHLAQDQQKVHRYSTLFTAQNVRDYLSSEAGIDKAIDWCRKTGITKVYIESFRSHYSAPSAALARARDRFRAAGFAVSGCVTTTMVGKQSTGWKLISCYTDEPTQDTLQKIFERTAGLFDEIMIDDFWFTDCECNACKQARLAKRVRVGDKSYPVSGDRWEDYRCELMLQLSRHRILEPARRVNPNVKIIIKYPQWYDRFQDRGYDVIRETAAFDRIWVGTETRDYKDKRWGGTPQYEGYFIMRWLGGIGGAKCGGGWFDPLGTTQATYLEQARQTILGGARESLLFCYGALQRGTGPNNIATLRKNLPELFQVAAQVSQRAVVGIAAYKPPNSHPENEPRVFDFAGMLGLPLVPCHEFPADAKAAFFSVHALQDTEFASKLGSLIRRKVPVLITDDLAKKLEGKLDLGSASVQILPVAGHPKNLLNLSQRKLDTLRRPLLEPFHVRFQAPSRVGLYLFDDGSWVVENFNDWPVMVNLGNREERVGARGWEYHWE